MTPPLLDRALDTLAATGVDAVLLRGDPADPVSDLDLLVDDPGLARTREAWRALGLAELAGDTHEASFVGYDREADRWLSVDVADAITVGRGRVPAAAILERASGRGPLRRPDPDDAWWLALVHEVGGRQRPRPERLGRLASSAPATWASGADQGSRLADQPTPASPAIRAALEATDGLAVAAGTLALALGTGGAGAPGTRRALTDLRSVLRGGLPEPVDRGRRALARGATRRSSAVTVALLGPDGVGKSTLAASLRAPRDRAPATVYLGLYGRAAGGRWTGRLPGLGLLRRLVHVAWVRVRVARLRAAGQWIVLDRHPIDGVTAAPAGTRVARLRRRLLAAAAPAPDLIIVLDAPVEVLLGRKREHGAERLAAMLDGYRRLAATDRRACLVDASGPADEVRRSVQAAIAEGLARRKGRSAADRAPGTAKAPSAGSSRVTGPRRSGTLARVATAAASRSGRLGTRTRRLAARLRARMELRGATPIAGAVVRDLATRDADRHGSMGLALGRGRVALSGTCVFAVLAGRDAGLRSGDPYAFLRLARRPVAARSVRRSAHVLRALGAVPETAALRPLLPEAFAAGRRDGWSYLLERAQPGVPASRRPPGDESWLEPAAAAVAGLHAATARAEPAEGRLMARLVDRPIRRVTTRLPPDPALADALEGLGRRTRAALAGCDLLVGWVHGDCWAGNVLLGPDGTVSGLIDWDSAACPAPAAVDLVHLLAHARRRRTGATYGKAFIALLDGTGLSDVERGVLEPVGLADTSAGLGHASAGLGHASAGLGHAPPGPNAVTADPTIRRSLLAIAWLYQVDGALRRYPRVADNRAWVDDVVRRVVACL